MKKLAVAFALIPALALADMKFGTVDMMVLVRNHKSYETNKRFLADSEKESQAKLDAMRADMEKLQTEGQKLAEEAQNPMLAVGKRQELEKKLVEIQKKFVAGQQAMRSAAMQAQQGLQESEAKFLKITGDDLRKTINGFAEKNGFDMIVDASAVPYAKKSFNVTDGVLKEMGVDPAKAVRSLKDGKKSDEGK